VLWCIGRRLRAAAGALRSTGLLRFWSDVNGGWGAEKEGVAYFSCCRSIVFSILADILMWYMGFVRLGGEVGDRELARASRRNDAQTEQRTPPSFTSTYTPLGDLRIRFSTAAQ
jgi:hypothetical protein